MPRRPETPNPIALAFGSAVRRTRDASGLTLEEVARDVPRLDPRYLGEIELGHHAPTIITAKRIADALGVSLGELVQDLP